MHADVSAVGVPGTNEIGAPHRKQVESARVVVQQNARRVVSDRPASENAADLRLPLRTRKHIVETGNIQRMAVDEDADDFVAEGANARLGKATHQACRVVVVVVAEARPLSVRDAYASESFIEGRIEVAVTVREEVARVDHEIGTGGDG